MGYRLIWTRLVNNTFHLVCLTSADSRGTNYYTGRAEDTEAYRAANNVGPFRRGLVRGQ